LKAWLAVLVLIALVAGGWYFFIHKQNKSTAVIGPANGNVDLSQKALIEGESGYPYATPTDLQACAQDITGGAPICSNVYSDNALQNGLAYKIAVPAGTYEVYSYSRSNPSVGRGYYNSITKCAPTVDEDDIGPICKKNVKTLTVTVSAGDIEKKIDAWWFGNIYKSN
jgi:hypothetical protein